MFYGVKEVKGALWFIMKGEEGGRGGVALNLRVPWISTVRYGLTVTHPPRLENPDSGFLQGLTHKIPIFTRFSALSWVLVLGLNFFNYQHFANLFLARFLNSFLSAVDRSFPPGVPRRMLHVP